MAFPAGWNRKCKLTIDHTKLSGTVSSFPVLITQENLPTSNNEIFDADGTYPADNGGGDVRFSSDSAGTTQLACEVVSFVTNNNPAIGTAEIWVNVGSISSVVDTDIYVWYNNSGQTQPAAGDSFGSQAVWDSSFKIVSHLQQDPSGGAPQMTDSTSNANSGTSSGMVSGDSVTGKITKGLNFDGTDNYISTPSLTWHSSNSFTFEAWVKGAAQTLAMIIARKTGVNPDCYISSGNSNNTKARFWVADLTTNNGGVESTATAFDSTWHHISGAFSNGSTVLYVDGESSGTNTNMSISLSGAEVLYYGARNVVPSEFFNGTIDEVRVSNTAKSADWVKASYNSQNSPSTFLTVGTPSGSSVRILQPMAF